MKNYNQTAAPKLTDSLSWLALIYLLSVEKSIKSRDARTRHNKSIARGLYKHQQTNTVNYNDRTFDQRLMNEFIYVPFIKIHSWNVCMSEINKQNLNKWLWLMFKHTPTECWWEWSLHFLRRLIRTVQLKWVWAGSIWESSKIITQHHLSPNHFRARRFRSKWKMKNPFKPKETGKIHDLSLIGFYNVLQSNEMILLSINQKADIVASWRSLSLSHSSFAVVLR